MGGRHPPTLVDHPGTSEGAARAFTMLEECEDLDAASSDLATLEQRDHAWMSKIKVAISSLEASCASLKGLLKDEESHNDALLALCTQSAKSGKPVPRELVSGGVAAAPAPESSEVWGASRNVAMRVAYLGEHYRGCAHQPDTDDTIEARLFDALHAARLISDRRACDFSRGGRTDKGVSAMGQTFGLRLRASALEAGGRGGRGVDDAGAAAPVREIPIDYVRSLNQHLPLDIRVTACVPVAAGFDARRDATCRTYKYLFRRGLLDVEAMADGASRLVGEHDFQHFCRFDPQVTSTVRRILSCDVAPLVAGGAGGEDEFWAISVCGSSFLLHQVRCMAAVLFLVGECCEEPSVVSQLLEVNAWPGAPRYEMAPAAPLLLHDISYDPSPGPAQPSGPPPGLAASGAHVAPEEAAAPPAAQNVAGTFWDDIAPGPAASGAQGAPEQVSAEQAPVASGSGVSSGSLDGSLESSLLDWTPEARHVEGPAGLRAVWSAQLEAARARCAALSLLLSSLPAPPEQRPRAAGRGSGGAAYVPLARRPTDESFADRTARFNASARRERHYPNHIAKEEANSEDEDEEKATSEDEDEIL